jgi:hypothetical protein
VDYNWSTTLTDEQGKNTFAVPLIYTNDTALVADKKSFMNYLKFNFFEIESSADGHSLQLKTIGNLQQSTLNTTGITTIFKQNFNTEYIIHPDEIIADNYMLLVYAKKKPDSINTLTEGGKTLLNKMKETLISFKN